MRIAILEDDPQQLQMMEQVVLGMGHTCQGYPTGAQLVKELRRESFDLLVLDWELPDTSGPEVAAWTRQELGSELPIIIVTLRSEEADIVQGLQSGADDFMTKPLRVAEFKARLQALLRRAHPASTEEVQQFGPYRFDRSSLSVQFGAATVSLTHREFALGLLLFQNPGRLMSRDYLREAVWGQNAEVLSRTLDTHISRLRQQLQLRPGSQYAIMAVYGLGYRLDVQAEGGPSC
ncbi:response regulator transcription factor [Comamonas nitrativorans]|uniref:Response regulator transcription factor n=1 Tax=Comamonas nitrativorans TaxID=108437 RepID=A0ABV9H070_9BURK